MRTFFDTEFVDTGKEIVLISIGLAREDGTLFYAETETPETLRHIDVPEWVHLNVYPQLTGDVWARPTLAKEIKRLAAPAPEFWGYACAYDWVALCQLYGRLLDRPESWPWNARDTAFLPDFKRYVITAEQPHHALNDAIALRDSYRAWDASYNSEAAVQIRARESLHPGTKR